MKIKVEDKSENESMYLSEFKKKYGHLTVGDALKMNEQIKEKEK